MAITLVDIASNTGGTSTCVLTLPSLQEGDVVYVAVHCEAFPSGPTITANNSFSNLTTNQASGARSARWFRKVMGPTPDTSVTISASAASWIAVAAVCLRGVDITTPEDATPTISSWATSTAPDSPSITTVTDGAWVLSSFGANNNASSTAPSGYSNKVEAVHVNFSQAAFATKEVTTAGAEDPGAWTIASHPWVAISIAVRPALTPGQPYAKRGARVPGMLGAPGFARPGWNKSYTGEQHGWRFH
jgi:hypothetical protein